MTATVIESVLKRERVVIGAGLGAMVVLAWVYLLLGAGTGMSALHMASWRLSFPPAQSIPTADWTATRVLVSLAMWWVMMIAMMVPSAAPVILLYARVLRHNQRRDDVGDALVPTASFAAGYLAVWLLFSGAAVALQFALESIGMLDAMMLWPTSRPLAGGLLIAAALYQLSPIKSACLGRCRSPVEWLARNWHHGRAGAFRMGVQHGAYCLGCCWVLMLLLFAGGLMNLVWIAGLAGLVLIEKLAPWGAAVSRWSSGVLAAAGALVLLGG